MTSHAASAHALRTVGRRGHAFDVAHSGDADQDGFIRHQVRFAQVFAGIRGNVRAAFIAIFFGQFTHVFLDKLQDLLRVRQQVFQMGNLFFDLLVFILDLLALQCSQAAQLHVQDGLRL